MIISVTDLSSYLWCPRSLYMQKVMGIEEPPNRLMVMGSLKHEVFEQANGKEQDAFLSVVKGTKEEEAFNIFYKLYIDTLAAGLKRKEGTMEQFGIAKEEAEKEMRLLLFREARDRSSSVLRFAISNDVYGYELWESIVPKVFAEVRVSSKELRLRGIVDKIELFPDKCITHEMKTGKAPVTGIWPSHRIQVAAYCMLAERKFNVTSTESVVSYVTAGLTRKIMMNPFMEQEVLDTTERVIRLFESDKIPQSCGKETCSCRKHELLSKN